MGQSTDQAIRFSERMSEEGFRGEHFREVLASHGIHVLSGDDGTRQIRVEGNENMPDIYVKVGSAAHNFDRIVFSELDPQRKEFYEKNGMEIPQYPIERRLEVLNTELMKSGYFETGITLDMLESKEKASLTLSPKAIGELERYCQEVPEGVHSHYYYFNNPEGEEERQAEREGRMFDFMRMAEKALIENGRPIPGIRIPVHEETVAPAQPETVKKRPKEEVKNDITSKVSNRLQMTIVLGGKSINFEMTAQQMDKLMAVDDSKRMTLIQKINPEIKAQAITSEQKSDVLRQVNAHLFAGPRPEIYISESTQQTQHVTPSQQQSLPDPKALAQANYAAQEASWSHTQSQSQGQGVGF